MGSRCRNSAYAGGGLCIATMRKALPSQSKSPPNLASQMRVAFSNIASKTGFKSPGDELIMRSTSAVAVCSSEIDQGTALQITGAVRLLRCEIDVMDEPFSVQKTIRCGARARNESGFSE